MLERSPQVCGPPSKLCLDVVVRIKLLAVVSGHRYCFTAPCGFSHPPAHPPPTQSVIVLFCTLPCRLYPETALLSPQFPRAQREKASRRNFPPCLTLVSLRLERRVVSAHRTRFTNRQNCFETYPKANFSTIWTVLNTAGPSLRARLIPVTRG